MKLLYVLLPIIFNLLSYLRVNGENPTVLIIGAGPAGVAAASRLLENNVTNIQIVEAEPRIGGRIMSVRFGDAIIDLGAEWCHGQKDNIVYFLVKDFNILTDDEFNNKIRFSTREELSDDFSQVLHGIFEDVYEKENDVPKKGRTVGEYFHSEYDARINKIFKDNATKLEIANAARKMFDRYIMSLEGCFDIHRVSAEYNYLTSEGNQGLGWNGTGYATILDVLIKKFPNPKQELTFYEKLLLNKTVSKINWNTTDTVTVELDDGSHVNANYVIFTPSLGVLKHNHMTLFEPALPHSKIGAINDLGFDAVMKIAVYFPHKWWDSNFDDTALLWANTDAISVSQEFNEGPQEDGLSWITSIFAVLQPEYNPNVLMLWLAGPVVPDVEKLPKETITKGVTVVLEKFFGHIYNTTAPSQTIWTNWFTNPHFHGTYSYETLASRAKIGSDEEELSKPLLVGENPKVLFAGESTNIIHYSTVHGAIETGFREADRIIELLAAQKS